MTRRRRMVLGPRIGEFLALAVPALVGVALLAALYLLLVVAAGAGR